MPSVIPAEPSHSVGAACFSWRRLRALYSANDIFVLGCWLTAALSTPLLTGPADAVGCIAIDEGDEGDDIGGFEPCRAVISGTDGKGHVAPEEA